MMEPAAASPGVQSGKSSGVIRPHKATFRQRTVARVLYLSLRAISGSLRYQWNDRSGYFGHPPVSQAIFCIWHNRLALCLQIYHRYAKPRNATPGVAAMVSASRDGGLLARILECFKVEPVRGSSSRRGQQALLEMTSWARRGYDLAITPDGPRGPRYVVQEGVIAIAQLTGLPIIPASYYLSRKICLKSWDRFQVPLPFARCEVVAAPAIRIPREISDEEREGYRQHLERTLREITRD